MSSAESSQESLFSRFFNSRRSSGSPLMEASAAESSEAAVGMEEEENGFLGSDGSPLLEEVGQSLQSLRDALNRATGERATRLKKDLNTIEQFIVQVRPEALSLDLSNPLEEACKEQRQHLLAFSRHLHQALDTEALLNTTVANLRRMLAADRVLIYRFHTPQEGMVVAESLTRGYTPALGDKLPATGLGLDQAGDYEKQPLISLTSPQTADLTPYQTQLWERYQVRSSLTVRLQPLGRVWGLLVVHQCRQERSWTEAEINLLFHISQELTLCMQTLELQTQAQQQQQISHTVTSITEQFQRAPDLQTLLETAVQEIRQAVGVDRCSILRFWGEGRGSWVAEDGGADYPALRSIRALADWVHPYAEPLQVVADLEQATLPERQRDPLVRLQVRAYLVVLLSSGQDPWGLLCLHHCRGPHAWPTREIELVKQSAAQLGLAIHTWEQATQTQARQDHLQHLVEEEQAAKIQLYSQIQNMQEELQAALEGDLTVTLSEYGVPDLQSLATCVRDLLQRWRQSLSQMQTHADQGASYAEAGVDLVATLSQAVQKPMQPLTQISQDLQAVEQALGQRMAILQQFSQDSLQVQQQIQASQGPMHTHTEHLHSCRKQVLTANSHLQRLSETLHKIGKVTALINTFTTQTNVLALNAAIEATRAGEQGRGFALVADEIRSLARQSVSATAEMDKLMQELQSENYQATTAMETGEEKLLQGIDGAADLQQSLEQVTDTIMGLQDLLAVLREDPRQPIGETADALAAVQHLWSDTVAYTTQLAEILQALLATITTLQQQIQPFKLS
jgi:methyl-accepting chemotaxis protein PixJ